MVSLLNIARTIVHGLDGIHHSIISPDQNLIHKQTVFYANGPIRRSVVFVNSIIAFAITMRLVYLIRGIW